ncbi:MAG: FAD-binding oxidoreductase [Pseudomonadota bacterium]
MALDTQLLDALRAVVGEAYLLTEDQVALIDPGVDPENLAAGLAVRPGDVHEVAGIVLACGAAGVPLITHGGRTGLARAAVSEPGQIVLLTDRLDRLEIDAVERVATIGVGVTLETLQEAAAKHGLSPGIDLAARGSATIGGLVSTNAGGMEAFRNGMMRQRLLGMEAVLPDGSIFSDLVRVTKNNEGYDLKQLLCGAEGTLGVVTEVTIRLINADKPGQVVLAAIPSAEHATRVMRALQDARKLQFAEIMWAEYARIIANACGLDHVIGFCNAPCYVVYQIEGALEDAATLLEPWMENGTILDAVIAQSTREADEIWRIREDSFAVERVLPHKLWYDVSLPVTALDSYVARLQAHLAETDPALVLSAMGHLADGNLHLTIGREAPIGPELADAVTRAVEVGIKDVGGSVSAEHGVGLSKLNTIARNTSPGKLAMMARIKAALDPNGIMNPGKVIP